MFVLEGISLGSHPDEFVGDKKYPLSPSDEQYKSLQTFNNDAYLSSRVDPPRQGAKTDQHMDKLLIYLDAERLSSRFGFEPGLADVKETEWLEEALRELDVCATDTVTEDFDRPSELGLEKAERILNKISSCGVSDQPDIYLMDEGSIAIDFRNPEGRSGVFFLVEKDGSGALFHRTQKSKGRIRVNDAEDLLDESRLQELTRAGIR